MQPIKVDQFHPLRFETLMTPGGTKYEPASCWKDVYYTLRGAQKLICITGWAVWDQLYLFRGEDKAIYDKTLGELLIEKANEGVQGGDRSRNCNLSPFYTLPCSVGLCDGLE